MNTDDTNADPRVMHITDQPKTLTVQQLVDAANAALERLSVTNPHRWLILQLASSMAELAARCEALEEKLGITATHLVAPAHGKES